MNTKLSPKTILVVVAIIGTVFFFAFNNDFLSKAKTIPNREKSVATQNVKISEKPYQSEVETIKRETQDDSRNFVKFQNGRVLKTDALADVFTAQGINLAQVTAVSVATDDFNADGYPDLVCGYAASEGGFLLVYFGDEQAFSPSNKKVIRDIADNLNFPVPFKTTMFIKLPDAPDFLVSGDFNRDGSKDILTAARGGQVLNLIANEGENLTPQQPINVGGVISTVAAGRKNLTDDFADVFVGINDGRVLIYEAKESIFEQTPLVQSLYAPAKQISLGNLDEDAANDLAIIADGRLFILHGDDALLRKDGGYLDPRAGQIEAIDLPFTVNNLTLGEFVWDRDSRTEIAALGTDGQIRVLSRGQLDTRPFTEEEANAGRLRAAQSGNSRTPIGEVLQRQEPKIESWEIAETFEGDSAAFLTTARSSAQRTDDLLTNGVSNTKIRVLSKNDAAQKSSVELAAGSKPIAVLPMRLNVMQPPGLVVLQKGQIEPTLVMLAPEATASVTSAADVVDAGNCSSLTFANLPGPNGVVSLREAICATNNTAGTDMITFSGGINPTLTISSGGNFDNVAANGDLDINGSVSIVGNSPTTISTTYNSTCGDCKLFGINQSGLFPSLAVSFSGLTMQGGFNNGANFQGTFFETGGGIDFFITGPGTAYTISNSTITGNTATGSNASHGGGINVDGCSNTTCPPGTPADPNNGLVTLTSVTVSNNTASRDGAGINLFSDKHDVTMTNPIITGNTAQQLGGGGINIRHSFGGTINISGVSGSVSNNSAVSGAGIAVVGNQIANISDVLVNNNTSTGTGGSSFGGGVLVFGLGALNVAGGTTLTNLTVTNNHADNGADASGGGVTFGGNYGFSMSGSTITGNTSKIGAGVLNQGSSETPAQVLTLTNCTIRGNTATGDGTTTGFGGGFAARGTGSPSSSVTNLVNVTIGGAGAGEGNSAVSGGGIANMNTSTTTVSGSSTIYGNSATSLGGGIFTGGIGANPTTGNTVTISNNVPIGGTTAGQGNSAPNGGGVYLNVGTFNYTATSGNNIAGNSATTSGGGLFNNGGAANLSGLIITGNTATNGSAIHTANGTTTLSGTDTVSGNINTVGGTLIGNTGNTTNLTGNFSQSSGTFTGNNSALNLTGNFSYTGGTFTAGTGTFNFNGTAAQSISNSSAITFNNLNDSNVTQPLTLNNSINVNGNLTANGANTILNPAATAVIGGTGTLTGTGTARVTRTAATADFLSQYTITNRTLTNLTVEYSGSAPQIISALTYGGLRLNNTSGATLASGTTTVNGTMTLQAGTLAVSTNTLILNSTVTQSGGTFSSASNGTVNYNQSSDGQTVIAANYGNLTFSNFNKILPVATVGIAGAFTPGTATGHTVTNNTINFNGTALQTIPVFPYFGLTLANAAGASLGGNVTVNGGLSLAAGALNVGTNTLTLNGVAAQTGGSFNSSATGTVIYNQSSDGQNVLSGTYGNLTFSNFNKILPSGNINILGTFTPGTATGHTTTGNTLTFNGTTAVSLPIFPYNNLVLNNPAGATLSAGTTTIGGTLTLTNGTLAVGTNTLVINGNASATGGSLTSAANGTVNYNQGSDGQTVIVANYGNLTFSNFNKVLPGGTVGIAGTFTPGTATGHTITGNTILFNGTSAQTIPAFTYNNLTINNAAGGTTSGLVTVNSTLTLTSGTFTVGAGNTLTLNGAATATGGSLSAANGTVNYNQGTNGQTILPASYGNLTFSNFNKIVPSGSTITILGVFTPGTAIGHTTTNTTFTFAGASPQTIPVFPYNNLTLNNAAGATLAGSTTVAGTLTLSNGTLAIGANTLTLNGAITATSGILSAASGTVVYNQGTNGQAVLATNYGNLTFSNFTKVLPGGTVGIAGIFTPGSAVGHTITGNTISFNGAGAQTIPAFTYNNLTTATGGVKTTSGAVNAASATVDVNTTLVVASGSTLTVTGTLTNNGTIQGLGTIVNNFTNAGTLSPGLSPGILNFTGNFTNSATVNVEIGGTGGAGVNPNGHDQLLITGTATLGGTLNVTLTNGFTPAPGNTFLILDAASSTGTFGTTNLPNIMPNTWNVAYNNANGTVILTVVAPVAAGVPISGRVASQNGAGISKARVTLTNSSGVTRTVSTNSFGYYLFEDVEVGGTYTITVSSKRYTFASRVIDVLDGISGLDFTPEP